MVPDRTELEENARQSIEVDRKAMRISRKKWAEIGNVSVSTFCRWMDQWHVYTPQKRLFVGLAEHPFNSTRTRDLIAQLRDFPA